jgi:hypothetical protein
MTMGHTPAIGTRADVVNEWDDPPHEVLLPWPVAATVIGPGCLLCWLAVIAIARVCIRLLIGRSPVWRESVQFLGGALRCPCRG